MIKHITIAGIDIPIVTEGTIGVAVSGGADSALLLFVLMSNLKPTQKVKVYTLGKSLNNYSNIPYAQAVVKYCMEKTGFANVEHNIRYLPDQTHDILYQPMLEDFNSGVISRFYSGVTSNPPEEISDKFAGKEENLFQSDRDPLIYRDIYRGEHSITPFTNINKKSICSMYDSLDLYELFKLTRSCENWEIEYSKTHCKMCWWCKEREWGFGRYE